MKNTLKKNYEFKFILKKGLFYSNDLLCIYIIKNKKDINRLGIVVSKKVGKAVRRNKIKRRIREAYRNTNNVKKGLDILIMWKAKQPYEKANYNKIHLQINDLFKKAKMLEEEI